MKDGSWPFEAFPGSSCETMKTTLDNKFSDSDYKSEEDDTINKINIATVKMNCNKETGS